MINNFINDSQKELAIKLYERFIKKKKNDKIQTTSI